jgi:hypothetical protein
LEKYKSNQKVENNADGSISVIFKHRKQDIYKFESDGKVMYKCVDVDTKFHFYHLPGVISHQLLIKSLKIKK